MPLVYAIEGISSPYEKITAVEPTAPAFGASLKNELLKHDLIADQYGAVASPRNRHPALKGYDESAEANIPERKPVLCAQDIMTKSVFHLTDTATLAEARKLMQREHIQHLPLLYSDDTLAGILSDRDILRAGTELDQPVATQMTRNVLTATPETSIPEIAEAMLAHHIHAMPIINPDLRVVGILTSTDILRAIVRRAPLALWA